MKLISFTGAQSSGKTTLLKKCKKQLPGKWFFVDEVTRLVKKEYNVNINEDGNDITQLLIINKHIENTCLLNTLDSSYDGIILDRCIVDGLVYTQWLYENGNVSTWVYEYALKVYDLLISKLDVIFYTDPNIPLRDDGERSTDIQFRDDMIKKFELLNGHNCKYNILSGSIKERFNSIKNIIIV
jgi:nicotinamide riboside kinase